MTIGDLPPEETPLTDPYLTEDEPGHHDAPLQPLEAEPADAPTDATEATGPDQEWIDETLREKAVHEEKLGIRGLYRAAKARLLPTTKDRITRIAKLEHELGVRNESALSLLERRIVGVPHRGIVDGPERVRMPVTRKQRRNHRRHAQIYRDANSDYIGELTIKGHYNSDVGVYHKPIEPDEVLVGNDEGLTAGSDIIVDGEEVKVKNVRSAPVPDDGHPINRSVTRAEAKNLVIANRTLDRVRTTRPDKMARLKTIADGTDKKGEKLNAKIEREREILAEQDIEIPRRELTHTPLYASEEDKAKHEAKIAASADLHSKYVADKVAIKADQPAPSSFEELAKELKAYLTGEPLIDADALFALSPQARIALNGRKEGSMLANLLAPEKVAEMSPVDQSMFYMTIELRLSELRGEDKDTIKPPTQAPVISRGRRNNGGDRSGRGRSRGDDEAMTIDDFPAADTSREPRTAGREKTPPVLSIEEEKEYGDRLGIAQLDDLFDKLTENTKSAHRERKDYLTGREDAETITDEEAALLLPKEERTYIRLLVDEEARRVSNETKINILGDYLGIDPNQVYRRGSETRNVVAYIDFKFSQIREARAIEAKKYTDIWGRINRAAEKEAEEAANRGENYDSVLNRAKLQIRGLTLESLDDKTSHRIIELFERLDKQAAARAGDEDTEEDS